MVAVTAIVLSTVPCFNGLADMTAFAQAEEVHQLRKDHVEWRYKTINGKLYRRQYNTTRKQWIGEWELVQG